MMNKMLAFAVALGVTAAVALPVQADPKSDLQQFQSYFKKKFPQIPFDEFANGLYALPAAKDRRAEWEMIMEFPPYELEVAKGKKFWDENKLASCFKNGGKGIAQHYPYWDKKRKMVRTIELDINDYLKKNGKEPIKDLAKGTMAQVVAYMKMQSRGKRVSLDMSDPGMVAAYSDGKKYYWTKRGQLNFACADCHVQMAGYFIGGNILSTGLGHGLGFPAYRSKWGALGTLHRRYGGCHNQVRAKPPKPQTPALINLETYETYMNTGLPLTAPSQRF